jgi:uncharacterized protein with PIN domain
MICPDCGVVMSEAYATIYNNIVAGVYQHDEADTVVCQECGEIYDVAWLRKYWGERQQTDLI